MCFLVVYCTDEDDWSGRGSWPLPDERGRFESIHARHVHVEQDHREILFEKATQSFSTRSGTNNILAQLFQNSLVREKLVGPIVDDQNIYLPVASGSPVVLEWNLHQR